MTANEASKKDYEFWCNITQIPHARVYCNEVTNHDKTIVYKKSDLLQGVKQNIKKLQ